MSLQPHSKARDATIGAVLFTALVLLAILQYQWIGQVSEADADRLRQGLRTSVSRFSDDFNSEIERLVQVVGRGPNPALWSDLSEHSGILKHVWAKDAADLPEHLRTFAGRLPLTIGDFRPGRGGGGRAPMLVESTVPAIAVVNTQDLKPQDLSPTMSLQWTILELDKNYIEKTWIPELIAKDFASEYDVHVGPGLERTNESESAPRCSFCGKVDSGVARRAGGLRISTARILDLSKTASSKTVPRTSARKARVLALETVGIRIGGWWRLIVQAR